MTAGTAPPDRVPVRTKLAYGLGAVAYGVKDNGFAVFLGFYYNQVVGMPPQLVGFILAAALLFDAFIDPALGVMSDRTRSRLGRRHPWLYASALPIALCWVLLWYPPDGSQAQILGWLGVTAVLTRAAIAANEVPSLALAPELTQDYHERTVVLRYRFLFGWVGGLGMLILAYGVFLRPPFGALTGPEAVTGYQYYGIAGAVIMAVTVLISAWGTQRRALEARHPPVEVMGFADTARALVHTLSDRAFLILMAAGLFGYVQQGVGFAISQYMLTFVWQFSPLQILFNSLSLIGGAILAFLIALPVSKALGKPKAVALFAFAGATLNAMPFILRFAGVMPEPGSNALLMAVISMNAIGTGFGIAAMILSASMMSDVVESAQERTGRREEGLFFSGALFVQKCASGVGLLVVGLILYAVSFPAQAVAGEVPAAAIDGMTAVHVGLLFFLAGMTALIVRLFPFGEADHAARVAALRGEPKPEPF